MAFGLCCTCERTNAVSGASAPREPGAWACAVARALRIVDALDAGVSASCERVLRRDVDGAGYPMRL